MLAPDPDVLDFVGKRVDGIVATIADARQKEMARRRIEACSDEIVAEEMLRRTPRWRWIARAIWRRRQRLAASRCAALHGTSGALLVCASLRGGG